MHFYSISSFVLDYPSIQDAEAGGLLQVQSYLVYMPILAGQGYWVEAVSNKQVLGRRLGG